MSDEVIWDEDAFKKRERKERFKKWQEKKAKKHGKGKAKKVKEEPEEPETLPEGLPGIDDKGIWGKKPKKHSKAVPAACQSPKPVVLGSCADTNAMCACWASQGECSKNPGYMNTACQASCSQCPKVEPPSAHSSEVPQPAGASSAASEVGSKETSEAISKIAPTVSPVVPSSAPVPKSEMLPSGPNPSSSAYRVLKGHFYICIIAVLPMVGF